MIKAMGLITYKNTYSSIVTHIITEVTVHYNGKHMTTLALWDTGASRTHISQTLIDTMDISSLSGEIKTLSHGGTVISKKYKVDITLPTKGMIKDITVFDTTDIQIAGEDINVLIGMDIISCGDFHIDSTGDKPIFTFRHPSLDVSEDLFIETELF